MIILVHVNDCTIAALSKQLIGHFKAKISEQVEIIDLGELHWLLGIEVECKNGIPFISPRDPTSSQSFITLI